MLRTDWQTEMVKQYRAGMLTRDHKTWKPLSSAQNWFPLSVWNLTLSYLWKWISTKIGNFWIFCDADVVIAYYRPYVFRCASHAENATFLSKNCVHFCFNYHHRQAQKWLNTDSWMAPPQIFHQINPHAPGRTGTGREMASSGAYVTAPVMSSCRLMTLAP